MPLARRRSGSYPARTRRKTSWELGPAILSGTVSISSSSSAILGVGAETLVDGHTLVRIRGNLTAFLTAATSAGDGFIANVGIGIVTAEAFAVGITACPLPQADLDWDGWLWMQTIVLRPQSFASGRSGIIDVEIDSKSMRKLNTGDTIFFAVEGDETGTAVLTFAADTRVLVKLP